MIMFIRRSSRSAAAPASGPSSRAGSSDVSQTPLTAAPEAATPLLARMAASAVSASRLSQSPRLDSDVAIHRRRNGLMDSTLTLAVSLGNRKVTALGYRSEPLRAGHLGRNVRLVMICAARHGHPVVVEDGRLRGVFPVRRAAAGPVEPVDERLLRAVPAARRRG